MASDSLKRDELKEVLEFLSGVKEKGADRAVVVQRYNEGARKYDEYANVHNYGGARQLLRAMTQLYPSNRDVIKILDVASGTGLSGLALWKAGFRQIDAVDPSQGMLDVAKEKNIYCRLICDFVDDKHQLDIPDSTYDAVTIAGGMAENHLPHGAFGEIVRVVKPGGVVVNVMGVQYFSTVEDYRINLTAYFRRLEEAGKWKEESRIRFTSYYTEQQGVVITHRVLC